MKTKNMIIHTAIIAVYVTLTMVLGSFSFGAIQIRLSEVMVVFCLVKKDYIYTITLACLISNCLGVAMGMNPFVLDIAIGTLATFISNILVYNLRNIKLFNKPVIALMMPVIINALLIGLELTLYMNSESMFIFNALYIALGEFVSCFLLGMILYEPLKRLIDKDEL